MSAKTASELIAAVRRSLPDEWAISAEAVGVLAAIVSELGITEDMWLAMSSAARDAHNQPWGWDVEGIEMPEAVEAMYDALCLIREASKEAP